MKHPFKSIVSLLLCVIMLATTVLTSCKRDNAGSDVGDVGGNSTTVSTTLSTTQSKEPEKVPVLAESVTLDKTTLSLLKGESAALTATVAPNDTDDKTLTWSTSNANVATVNNGTVMAVGAGNATITVTTANGKTATCEVIVNVLASAVTLNKTELSLIKGNTETLTATVDPEDTTDKTLTWASSAESVATVTDGKVTAVGAGTATITVTTANGKTATCEVTVSVLASHVRLNKHSISLLKGASDTLIATVSPDDVADKTVTWSTSNASVATVENGVVTAVSAGSATITVTTANGKTDTCYVMVSILPTGITLDKTLAQILESETTTLIATISPSDATDKTIQWTTSNASVAVVANGVITAMSPGTATITATDSEGHTATCTVTVTAIGIGFKTLSVDGYTVSGKVSNTTNTFSFINEISSTNYARFEVYSDYECKNIIKDKTPTLQIGDNIFYILEYKNDDVVGMYTVTIRRLPMYTVTFDTTGGSKVSSQTVEEGSLVSAPITTRTGYTFVRWDFDFENPITDNTTIQAIWTANTNTVYQVEYYLQNLGDGGYTLTENIVNTGTTGASVSAEIKTFDHFTYNASMSLSSGTIAANGRLILKVYYTRNQYIVTFDVNGGTLTSGYTAQRIKYGESVVAPTLIRVGYTFNGWDKTLTEVTSDITVTAIWTANTDTKYTVKHYIEKLDCRYELKKTDDLAGTSDSEVTPATYSYTGFTAPTTQTVTILPDGSRVVEYYYTRNSYTITFVTNSGDATFSQTLRYEAILPQIARAGFDFGGWFTDIQLSASITSVSSQNITVYAYWIGENKPSDFTFSGTDSVSINKYLANDTSVIIPSYIGGLKVTSIGSSAFSECPSLTSVIIPDSVSSINAGAFSQCTSLTSVTIGKGVTDIGNYAFRGCSNLNNLNIPDNVTNIGNYAFANCSSLKNVMIGKGITRIGSAVFSSCGSLTSITIPNNIINIDDYAFSMSGLTSITIPDTVNSIGFQSFAFCNDLTSVTIGKGLTSTGEAAFAYCNSLTSVIIPNNITSIAPYTFEGCSNLTSITFIGNISQWNTIVKRTDWNYDTGNYTIYCTDGTIAKDGTTTYYSLVELYVDGELWQSLYVDDTLPIPVLDKGFECIWLDKDKTLYADATGTVVKDLPRSIQLYSCVYKSGHTPIYTTEQFYNISLNGKYCLTTDLDLDSAEYTPIGKDKDSPFEGVFDGNGHVISNFKITGTATHAGLFGYSIGTIKNLGIENFVINVNHEGTSVKAGGLVGYNNGNILNCYVSGDVKISHDGYDIYVGGLIGYNGYSNIVNCYASVNVTVSGEQSSYSSYIGGLIGYNGYSNIVNCYASGDVTASTTGNHYSYVGGLVGYIYYCDIFNCYASGDVTVSTTSKYYHYIGGLVGYSSSGNMSNSYASGNITASTASSSNVGGLYAYGESTTIKKCYRCSEQSIIVTKGESTKYSGTNSYGTLTDITNLQSKDWVEKNLWSSEIDIWNFNSEFPTLNYEAINSLIEISTKEDLLKLQGSILVKNYCLVNSIDLGGIEWTPIAILAGNFNGCGYEISNFKITSCTDAVGLFAKNFGMIENLGLVNIIIDFPNNNTQTSNVGALVGKNAYGIVTNCFATVSISTGYSLESKNVGGLIGYNSKGTVINCYTKGTIIDTSSIQPTDCRGGLIGSSSLGQIIDCYAMVEIKYATTTGSASSTYTYDHSSKAGGLVGSNSGQITNCYATGNISSSLAYGSSVSDNNIHAGGLVGSNSGVLSNCYATGNVSASSKNASTDSKTYVGGLVGSNSGEISNCYATGNANFNIESGEGYAGGLIGDNSGDSITNCHALGNVDIDNAAQKDGFAGGLIGYNEYGTITNCYATGNTKSRTNVYSFVGGLVGAHKSYDSTVTNCYATGTVSGSGAQSYVGGLFGSLHCKLLTNCYATGNISATGAESHAGGLVGYLSVSVITNCYAYGSVTADASSTRGSCYVGGLVAYSLDSVTTNCYATGNIIGRNASTFSYIGGLFGLSARTVITNCYATGDVSFPHGMRAFVAGLIGSSNTNQIINCYSTSNISYNSISTDSYSGIVAGLIAINSNDSTTINNSYRCNEQTFTITQNNKTRYTPDNTLGEAKDLSELQSVNFQSSTLGWSADDWNLSEESHPTLKNVGLTN